MARTQTETVTIRTRIDGRTTSRRTFNVGNNVAAAIGSHVLGTPDSLAYARSISESWQRTFGPRITRQVRARSGAYHATIAGHDYWILID